MTPQITSCLSIEFNRTSLTRRPESQTQRYVPFVPFVPLNSLRRRFISDSMRAFSRNKTGGERHKASQEEACS